MRNRRQQQIIFDVKDARSVVRAFQKRAELDEIIAVITQHRAVQRAAHMRALLANCRQHVGQIILAHWPFEQRDERHPARVDRFPRLARQRRPRGARIVARQLDHRQDARRVRGIAKQKIDDARRAVIAVRSLKRLIDPRRDQHRFPLGGGGRRPRQRDTESRIDQARIILATLEVTRHPEQRACGLA